MFGGSLFLVLFLLAIVLSNTAYPSRTSEFTSCFRGVRVAQSLVFFEVFCRSLFVLLSFGHCIVCSPYDLWLPLCYLLVIVLSVLLTASDYPFVIFWPLYCLSSLRLLITPLLSFGHCIACPPYCFWLPLCYLLVIVLSVFLTAYDYPFVIFWSLYCLSFDLGLLITPLLSFGHCIACPPYCFWLHLCYILAIVLSVLRFRAFDYPFVVLDLGLLITPLLS